MTIFQAQKKNTRIESTEGIRETMAKATITIRQGLQYQPHQACWFAATTALFNRVAAFYFEVIQEH